MATNRARPVMSAPRLTPCICICICIYHMHIPYAYTICIYHIQAPRLTQCICISRHIHALSALLVEPSRALCVVQVGKYIYMPYVCIVCGAGMVTWRVAAT